MSKKKYHSLLKDLKETNWGLERLLLVDDELITAIVAWPYVTRKILKESRRDEDDVWGYVLWDVNEWAELSRLHKSRLKNAAERLIKLKLIFPDGALPNEVIALIRTKISEKLPVKVSQKKQ